MRVLYILLLLPVLLLKTGMSSSAQFPASCDRDRSCIGRALTIQVTSGKSAQYVDIDSNAILRSLSTELTVEAWIKPEQQPGKRIFLAGLWGPNTDNNDQWVIYIENERITFALSPEGSAQGDVDNTVVSATVAGLYTRGWTHVAAVWDGTSTVARLIIDGYEGGRATNPASPLTTLNRIESQKLPTQLGSCNGLYDDTVRFRTFKGQIDEFRIWGRALPEDEVRCSRLKSLQGNESGLLLYYRCNDATSAQSLCDATGNNLPGLMRSGAQCMASDRVSPLSYTAIPSSFGGTLYCTGDTTFTVTVTDTSSCGNQVAFSVVGADAGLFTVTPRNATLQQGTPVLVTVRLRATVVGPIQARFRVSNSNRCGAPLDVPFTLTRRTELDYSKGRLQVDTLYVGCIERSLSEDTLEICNRTGRPMRIDNARLAIGAPFSWRPQDPARPLPLTLANGECWKVIVQMRVGDTSYTSYDTLLITSDDQCPGSGIIPVEGRTQEVLAILDASGFERLDSMNFGAVCPGQISDVRLYQLRNMVLDSIFIDTLIFDPSNFYGRRVRYPQGLAPNFAYLPTYIRFRPDRPGPLTGEARFQVRYRGCTIVRSIYLRGRGIAVDVVFNSSLVGFGNVTIGKSAQQNASITNRGDEARRMSAYLKVGDVFRIISNRTFVITPGQTLQIGLEFRPRQPINYYDTLCIFDEQCYQTICIPVSGTGVFEDLSFTPSFLSMENVVGCRCRVDTLTVTNVSGGPQNITQARLNDATGKFTLLGSVPTGGLAPGASFTYIVQYCPGDLVNDRADNVFLDLSLASGQLYQVVIRATSVVPRLYVTPVTVFGAVEVGWRRRELILVENASAVPITVNSANVPAGYAVISTTPPLPAVLQPRDSMWVEVELAPTAETNYSGSLTLTSDDPCQLSWSGTVSGKGEIIRLAVPVSFINYGLIPPCSCAVREIPLPNLSEYIPLTIDSIWIDGAGVTSPRPEVFLWRSKQTGDTNTPYTIDPKTVDTLEIVFCPNIPATPQNVLSNATIHISARTKDWAETFQTVLSGRRELNFTPTPSLVQFPATRVDTWANPIQVRVTIPGPFQNPSGDSLVITGVAFVPDQRVFSVTHPTGQPFPWIVRRGERLDLDIHFYPRAPRSYVARLHLETSFPCAGVDTTVEVRGRGFANRFGFPMAFDTARVETDTFHITTCDTLVVPIMATRGMPQELIDVLFRIVYDSTALRLLDVSSPYTTTATIQDTGTGAWAYLKDVRNAGPGAIATVRFVARGGAAQFPIRLSDIEFDSDSLVTWDIVPTLDDGWVIIDDPMIAISPLTDFDTVNLKSCADQVVTVWNPGAVPVLFDSLGGLPPGHRVTATSRPLPDTLAPGDSIQVTVTFCPWVEDTYDAVVRAYSSSPCPVSDSGAMRSVGFAPPFPMRLLLSVDPNETPIVGGTIADTVEMSIYADRDVPQTPLDVNLVLVYNRRSLQFIGAASAYSAGIRGVEVDSGVYISIPHCDSIRSGELARLRFIVAVPDSILSPMRLVPLKYASDSVFWVKLDPPITQGDTGAVRVDPRCNISRLIFRAGANKLTPAAPNPTSGRTTFEAEMIEDARPRLALFNSAGIEVMILLDGSELLHGGRYRFEFDTGRLASGDYFIVLDTGRFRALQRFQVVR